MIPKQFPTNWASVPLSSVGKWLSGGTPSKATSAFWDSGTIPWVSPKDMKVDLISSAEDSVTEAGASAAGLELVPENSILMVVRSGILSHTFPVARNTVPVVINQDLKVVIPDAGFSPAFVAYQLKARQPEILTTCTKAGTTVASIQTDRLHALALAVAPLNEQRRIVAKLDALVEKIRAIRDKLDRVPRLLANLQKSILNAAFRGELTREWRAAHGSIDGTIDLYTAIQESHERAGGHKRGNAAAPTDGVHDLSQAHLPNSWVIAELRDLCQPMRPICYGILKPGPDVEGGVPYIRVADFPGDKLQPSGIRRTSPEIDAQFVRSRLQTGDLLMSIRGTVGRLCVIPEELTGANTTQDSARLSIHEMVNSEYVRLFLKSPEAQRRMACATKGVAIRGINIGDVRALQIPLPERAEQDEIVRQVTLLLDRIRSIDVCARALESRTQTLQRSCLDKAFCGELVAQDPADEPASVLLQQIRAQREASPAKAGQRRKVAGTN